MLGRAVYFLAGAVCALGGGWLLWSLRTDLDSLSLFPPQPQSWLAVAGVLLLAAGVVFLANALIPRPQRNAARAAEATRRAEALSAADTYYAERNRAADRDWRSGDLPPVPAPAANRFPESEPAPEPAPEPVAAPVAWPAPAFTPPPPVAAPEPPRPAAKPVASSIPPLAPPPTPFPSVATLAPIPPSTDPPPLPVLAAPAPAPPAPAVAAPAAAPALAPPAPVVAAPAPVVIAAAPEAVAVDEAPVSAPVPAPVVVPVAAPADPFAAIRAAIAGGRIEEADKLLTAARETAQGVALAELTGLAGDHAAAAGRQSNAKWLWRLALKRFGEAGAMDTGAAQAVAERLRLADN